METPAAPPPPAPPPRRKRWKKVLLIVGSVLAGLVLLILLIGPMIICSVARSKIPALVSEMLEADATVGDVSFSWSGRIGIRDLRIVPRGFTAPLLELPQVDVSVALLSAARGKYVVDVEVVRPRVVVEKRADGRFSYEVTKPASSPAASPAPAAAPAPLPDVLAKLRVREGQVALRAHGQETVYGNVTLDAAVYSLSKPIVYALSLAGPAQDRIAVKGEYAISSGSGPVAVELERLSLKNLAAAARAFGPVEGLDGRVTGRLDYELKGAPAASGKARLAVSDLFLRTGGRDLRLPAAELAHEGGIDARGSGRQVISLSAGKAVGAMLEVDLADLFGTTSAKVGFKPFESDLAELRELLAGFLPADLSFRGTASIWGQASSKGRTGWADLRLETKGLSITKGKQTYALGTLGSLLAARLDEKGDGEATLTPTLDGVVTGTVNVAATDVFGARKAKTEIALVAELKGAADLLRSWGFVPADFALEGKAALKGTVESEGPRDEDLAKGFLKVPATWSFESLGRGIRGSSGGRAFEVGDVTHTNRGSVDANGNGRSSSVLDSGAAMHAEIVADLTGVFGEPGVVATLKAESDLAEVGRRLQGFLKADTDLAGKAVVSGRAELRGAAGARADLAATVTNLAAVDRKTKKAQVLDPEVRLKLAARWDAALRRATLETLSMNSSFATADGKGSVTLGERPGTFEIGESSLTLNADLKKLADQLASFLKDPPELAGRVVVTGTYAGDRFDLTAKAVGVKAETKTASVGPVDATLVQKGELSLKPGGVLKIEACRLDSSALTAELKGEVRKVMDKAREGTLTVTAGADPVELSKWVKDLGLGGPKIALEATVTLGGETLKVEGRTKLDGLTMKAKDAAGKEFVRTAKSGSVEFRVEQGKDLVATLKAAAFEWTDPAYAAKCSLDAQVTMSGNVVSGTTKLGNLEIVDDKKNVVKDPGLTVRHEVEVDAGKIDLRKVALESGFLKGGVAGRIVEKDGMRSFEGLKLNLEYLPDRMAALLKPWLPGKLEGAEWKRLTVTLDGRAASGDLLAIFRGVASETTLDLAKFTKDGMSVSGRSEWKLKGGVLSSGTPLDVNGGKSSLDLTVDFREEKQRPQSRLVLGSKEVGANAEMKVLEKINPIFSTVNGTVDGRITSDFNLVWDGPVDPAEKDWTAAAAKRLSGSGVFGMKDLSITGSETVRLIMAAMGEPNALKGELVATNIAVGQGRCSYTNMTLRLARYELRFSGQVTFDGKLQLQVDLPFTDSLVKKNPGLAKYTGQRFSVNLTGTVADPRFDYEATIAAYVKRALEGVIQDKAKDLLEDLLKKKKP